MIHQVIQIIHSTLDQIFKFIVFVRLFLYFSMYSISWDSIKKHIYCSFLYLFYLKSWIIVYENQMFCYESDVLLIFRSQFLLVNMKNIIWQISWRKFSDVLPAFTGTSATCSLRNICLGVKSWVLFHVLFCV